MNEFVEFPRYAINPIWRKFLLKIIHTKIIDGKIEIPLLNNKKPVEAVVTYIMPEKESEDIKLRGIFKDKLKGINIEEELKNLRFKSIKHLDEEWKDGE